MLLIQCIGALVLLFTVRFVSPGATADAVRFLSEPVDKPVTGAVSVIDPQHAWIGLTYTEDGGTSWTARRPTESGTQRFIDMPDYSQPTHFLTASRGWLTGIDSVWMTDDGGLTWRRQVPGHIHTMTFEKGAGWMAAGNSNSVQNYITADRGETWTHCGVPWRLSELAPLSAVSFISPRTGWITVANYNQRELPLIGGVAKTTDGGCTWETLWRDTKAQEENLAEIRFIDDSFGWLTATYGRLLETKDGGRHWTPVRMPKEWINLESAYLVDRTHGWIIGSAPDGLALYYTSDDGRQWTSVSKEDFLASRGLATEIPTLWGAAFLTRIQLASLR